MKSACFLKSLATLSAVLLFSMPIVVSAVTLVNGSNQTGIIFTNTTDSYTFTANKGDSINLRLGTTGFYGWLQLYGPGGSLLAQSYDDYDRYINNYVATNSGTFTVHVSSYSVNGTGTYVLHLAQIPEAFVVPAGDEGGALANGANATGTITLGDLDMWTFTANKGDAINLRLGTTNFYGWLQLFGPDGSLLAQSYDDYDRYINNYIATNSGTFTVMVSSYSINGTGTYVLHLAQVPEAFVVPAGDEGGALANGANATGTITLGDLDMWTFTANKGDAINLRLGTTNFYGWLQLFGPDGSLLAQSYDDYDRYINNYIATNSGIFTVMVSSYSINGTGTYVLHLAQVPEAFVLPAGDEGGALANGANATGTITLGDLDMWTFTANRGDAINLRLGTTNFYGWLQLFGPDGSLLAQSYDDYDRYINNYIATNSGTFTVMVSSYSINGTGTYVLNLAQMPEPFVISSGDQGGAMSGGTTYAGTITLGDQDIWSFTACTGDSINLGLNTTNFYGWLELYGPNGTLLKTAADGTALGIAYTATNCGTFTVFVSSYSDTGTGTYGFTANRLADTMRVCFPTISGTNLIVNGVGGGTTNATFILYSTTNIATPFGLWKSVLTNHFDQFGVLNYSNTYSPSQNQSYFRFISP